MYVKCYPWLSFPWGVAWSVVGGAGPGPNVPLPPGTFNGRALVAPPWALVGRALVGSRRTS